MYFLSFKTQFSQAYTARDLLKRNNLNEDGKIHKSRSVTTRSKPRKSSDKGEEEMRHSYSPPPVVPKRTSQKNKVRSMSATKPTSNWRMMPQEKEDKGNDNNDNNQGKSNPLFPLVSTLIPTSLIRQ